MKHITSLLLIVLICLYFCACTKTETLKPIVAESPTPTADPSIETTDGPVTVMTDDPEILRAISYGLVPTEIQSDFNAIITFTEYCTMLKKLISLYDAELIPAFENKTAAAIALPNEMKREDGVRFLFCAADIIGKTTINSISDDWIDLHDKLGENRFKDVSWKYPYLPDSHDRYLWEGMKNEKWWASFVFCWTKTSWMSGKTLFEYDAEANSMHWKDMLTREMAIHAVVRLYESDITAMKELWTPQVEAQCADILKAADSLQESILYSPAAIHKNNTFVPGETYTSAAYYVSPNGDDSYDGLSPESPWATVDRVNSAQLSTGDAVFFERGGLWRESQLMTQKGITYSAYGEGEKPRFFGSGENGGGAEKWDMHWRGDNGEKIWVYTRDIKDVACVVFDDGDNFATIISAFWDGSRYVCESDHGREWIPEEQLTVDMTFFCMASSTLPSSLPIAINGLEAANAQNPVDYGETSVGPLYLRCDEGNPGELYDSIEFIMPGNFGDTLIGCTLDNLCIRYYNMGLVVKSDVVVQNCEIGWCGGNINGYYPNEKASRQGGAIALNESNCVIIHNYVHHAYDEGISLEMGHVDYLSGEKNVDFSMRNNRITGNLVTYCGQPLLICNWDTEVNQNHIFIDCTFEENYVLYSGFDDWSGREGGSAISFQASINAQESLVVKNNVFFISTHHLIHYDRYTDTYSRVFEGNTYVAAPASLFLMIPESFNGKPANHRVYWFNTASAEDTLHALLGDETGHFVFIDTK